MAGQPRSAGVASRDREYASAADLDERADRLDRGEDQARRRLRRGRPQARTPRPPPELAIRDAGGSAGVRRTRRGDRAEEAARRILDEGSAPMGPCLVGRGVQTDRAAGARAATRRAWRRPT